MKVVGIRRVDIEKDGVDVHGYKYYVTDSDQNVAGLVTDSFFASDTILSNLSRDIELDDIVFPCYKRGSTRLSTIILA